MAPRESRGVRLTSVLVIDDHPIVAEGCRRLFKEAGAENVILARSFVEGLAFYRSKRPDLIVFELAIEGNVLAGLSFIHRLRVLDKTTPLLALTVVREPIVVGQALKQGTTSYLLKDASEEEILKAFNCTRHGRAYLSEKIATEVLLALVGRQTDSLQNLTLREYQTLALISQGKSLGTAAAQLNIGSKTVANTCTRLKAKLGVRTFAELMAAGIRLMPPSINA